MNDPGQVLEYGQRAVEKALATDRVECICNGFACVGFGLLQSGKLPEAAEAFQESIRRSVASGAARIENTGRTGLAITEFMGGQIGAVADMENTLESARVLDDPYSVAFLSQTLGQSYTHMGQLDRAEGYLKEALDYYRHKDMRPYIARTLQSLADLYDKQGRSADAERARSEAGELARGLAKSP
jgi:tetratricopeptide (TPR) repeat protein